ncbi:MAG: cell division protein FtsL [Pseudomonadota bacterium]
MTRLNLVLLVILMGCALMLVTSQHQARKLYVELQKEQELGKRFEVEWGQLQLEQSTWAMHARIEKIATRNLGMRVPSAARVQVLGMSADRELR